MPKFTTLLLLVLSVLAALQLMQTQELRKEVRALKAQLAAQKAAPADDAMKAAGARLQQAAKAAASGNLREAGKAAGEAVKLLDRFQQKPAARDLQKTLEATRDYLNQMIKGVYRPNKEDKP